MIYDQDRLYEFLKRRSLVVQAIRDFFTGQGYLEVDTPIRCRDIIPEAQIEPVVSEDYFLQASPEIFMKRLLSNGFDKIFQLCKTFRKNEHGSQHLPEFTLLEWYTKEHTYFDLMDQCYGLINFIADALQLKNPISFQGQSIDISSPWQKLTVKDAFERYSDTSLKNALKEKNFDEIISFQIEPSLGNESPLFLYDYPSVMASLAKLRPDTPDYAQRFELYIRGIELANGFTELNNAQEQRQRFEKENQIRQSQNKKPLPIPEIFLRDLEHMPDAAGIAMGIDRLVMIFCDTPLIDDVVTFTT